MGAAGEAGSCIGGKAMRASDDEKTIGVWLTGAIVVSTVIGSGIFLLPSSLAPLGKNALIAWVISGVGALCIAFALSRVVRGDGGGIQSYVETVFGPTTGFVVAFSFWVSSWAAMAATAIAAAAALSRIVPGISDPWSIALVALAITASVTAVNARGIRASGSFSLITVGLRILPILAVIFVVLLHKAKGQPLAPIASSPVTASNIATAVTLTLFAITGFEAATAPVGKVRNPTWTIPAALMGGTAFCVLLYLFSSTAVTLILSPSATASSLAPYADALKGDFGEMAAKFAAGGIAIAAIGSLNSNLLCAGELGYSMALRGDFPARLAQTGSNNTPMISLLVAAGLTALLVLSNTSKSTVQLFIFVSLLATIGSLALYLVGALAALRIGTRGIARAVIGLGVVFSLFAFYGAGLEANLWGLALILAGLAVRLICRLRLRAGKLSVEGTLD